MQPTASTPTTRRLRLTRSRWAAIGAAVAVTLGGAGLFQANAATPTAAASFTATTPCRLLDTRPGPTNVGPRATPLAADDTATSNVHGSNGNCTVPSEANALVMNVTVVEMTGSSFLTVYPSHVSRPDTSNLNWLAGDGPTANAVTTAVSTNGQISFYNLAGTTHLIADVVGYYSAGTITDTYSRAEVDALIAANPGGIGPVGPPGPTGEAGPAGAPGADGADGDSVVADLSCATDQIIRFDGTNWACSDDLDTVGNLDCDANQSAAFDGTSWVCRSTPIVSTLSRLAFASGCCSLDQVFAAYSPNVESGFCDEFLCEISLVDVVDHTGCDVTFTGNSRQGDLDWFAGTNEIFINHMLFLEPSEPLYVTISCIA